jgi:hypothetical protein
MKLVFAAAAAVLLMGATQPRGQSRPAPQAAPVQGGQQTLRIPTRASVRILLGICTTDNGACLTYVLGAADAWSSAAAATGRPQLFCFPAGTPNQQIAQSAVQYLRARPQEAESNAAAVLLGAFIAIYPCPR